MKRAIFVLVLATLFSPPAWAEENVYIGYPDHTLLTHQEVADKYMACDLDEEYPQGDPCVSYSAALDAFGAVDDICAHWTGGVCDGAGGQKPYDIYNSTTAASPLTVSCFDIDGRCMLEGGSATYARDNSTTTCSDWAPCPLSGGFGGGTHRTCCSTHWNGWIPVLRCVVQFGSCRNSRPWPPP